MKKSYHRYLVVLDLEMNQPSGKIIEVGAVVGDTETGAIVDTLRYFVNPREPITPFITDLTGISDADVSAGGSVLGAYEALKALCVKWGACRTLYTWGGGDSAELKNQLVAECPGIFDPPKAHDKVQDSPSNENMEDDDSSNGPKNPNFYFFGHRWEDMKTVYKTWGMANDVLGKAGLDKALTKLGLTFEGTPHRALDDATNTWKVFLFFKKLMLDNEARPGAGRRPMNALETREKKRREKIVATALSISEADLSEVSAAIGPPPVDEGDQTKTLSKRFAWSEKALAFLRQKNREKLNIKQ